MNDIFESERQARTWMIHYTAMKRNAEQFRNTSDPVKMASSYYRYTEEAATLKGISCPDKSLPCEIIHVDTSKMDMGFYRTVLPALKRSKEVGKFKAYQEMLAETSLSYWDRMELIHEYSREVVAKAYAEPSKIYKEYVA